MRHQTPGVHAGFFFGQMLEQPGAEIRQVSAGFRPRRNVVSLQSFDFTQDSYLGMFVVFTFHSVELESRSI